MIFADALEGMHLYIDVLSRAQLCEHDVQVRWRRYVRGQDCRLLALGNPLELRREDLGVDVEHLGIRRVPRCVFSTFAGDFEAKDERVAIRRLIVLG